MSKTLTLIFALFLVPGSCLAQEQPIPTRIIVPEDVVQESIQSVRLATNKFVVRWTYNQSGAKRMLAFRETHEGQQVRTTIGSFTSAAGQMVFQPMPPLFRNYAEWREGWLKRPTDKCFGVSEENAKRILA